jgi:RP/EB family microtubule-associated protein
MVAKVEMLTQENAQLQATVEGLEKERDFYFEKLTIVEEMLQERQAAAGENAPAEMNDLVEQVFKILYATDSASAALAVSGGSEPTATAPAAAADLTSV